MERYLSTIVINNHMLLILSIKCIKVNERSPGSDTIKSRSQPMTPRGREKKDSKQCIREPNRTTLSSPSEVNRTKKKHENKEHGKMRQLMRLWHFSSSVNSFFKRPCAAIYRGYMFDFWSDPSSTSILHVCEQRRLWRDCADAQAHLSLRWSPM